MDLPPVRLRVGFQIFVLGAGQPLPVVAALFQGEEKQPGIGDAGQGGTQQAHQGDVVSRVIKIAQQVVNVEDLLAAVESHPADGLERNAVLAQLRFQRQQVGAAGDQDGNVAGTQGARRLTVAAALVHPALPLAGLAVEQAADGAGDIGLLGAVGGGLLSTEKSHLDVAGAAHFPAGFEFVVGHVEGIGGIASQDLPEEEIHKLIHRRQKAEAVGEQDVAFITVG